MAIVAGFFQSAKMTQACGGPKLARTFSAALSLATGRFNGTTADGPAVLGHSLIVQAVGVLAKVILLAPDHFAPLATPPR